MRRLLVWMNIGLYVTVHNFTSVFRMYASLDDVKLEMEVESEDKSSVTETASQPNVVYDAVPTTGEF